MYVQIRLRRVEACMVRFSYVKIRYPLCFIENCVIVFFSMSYCKAFGILLKSC